MLGCVCFSLGNAPCLIIHQRRGSGDQIPAARPLRCERFRAADRASRLLAMATVERSIEKWPLNHPSGYHARLKCMYFDSKKFKNFVKGVGRLVDISSDATLWFEITGNSTGEVTQRALRYLPGRAGTFKNLTIKPSNWHSGGRSVSLNPGAHGVVFTPMAAAHPDFTRFPNGVVAPVGDIGDFLQSAEHERVDAIGLVTQVTAGGTRVAVKTEVWLKGEDSQVILIELWGATFKKLLADARIGHSVLQVENARVVRKGDDTVHLTAESFKDSDMGGSWAFLDPPHARTNRLQAMDAEGGVRISSLWTPANPNVARLTYTQGQKFKTCAGSLRACSLAWTDPEQSTSADELPERVYVALQSVFLTEIANTDPVYVQCKLCRSKVDPETGNCKKASADHVTEPGDEKVALSSVRLADFSGSVADVLAETNALCGLASVQDVSGLEDLLARSGRGGASFRGRYDVVLGAGQVKKSFTAAGRAPRQSADGPECKFEVLKVTEVETLVPWDTPERPALEQILEAKSDPSVGHVVPIKSPNEDLIASSAGVKFARATSVLPQYVLVLGRVDSPPQEQTIGEGPDAMVEVVHPSVMPVGVDAPESNTFGVQLVCQVAEVATKRMPNGKPYLIVGGVSGTRGEFTVLAENIFDLEHIPNAVDMFTKELEGAWRLLCDGLDSSSKKRSAKLLVEGTPKKKKVEA